MQTRPTPKISVTIEGRDVVALVDTGCTTTMVQTHLVNRWSRRGEVLAFDGRKVRCHGRSNVKLELEGHQLIVEVIVADRLVPGVEAIIGMDVICQLGGVTVTRDGVKFETARSASTVQLSENGYKAVGEKSMVIEDQDFRAEFNGREWTVEWFFKDNPPELRNKVACYENSLQGSAREEFEREVDRWIDEGILMPWKEEVTSGILPLMAVIQPTKNKVRPVLDFRELNDHVECHTGGEVMDICGETLREWRRMTGASTLVDLKSAYLQLKVNEKLWKYQLVRYKNKTYCLTRLGFGLNSAPKIRSIILKTVLERMEKEGAVSSYIDDILVNETIVTAAEVVAHLKCFGLAAKLPETLDGGAALGLKLKRSKAGGLEFQRGNQIPEAKQYLSRRELFSICGKLTGHYPVAGWLRTACSYIKRHAEGEKWEDKVGEKTTAVLREVLKEVNRDDPVKGKWDVPKTNRGTVWCDASSIATGVILEVGGVVAEDAAWLRKKGEASHINVAELDAVLKGVNLALKWGLQDVSVKTDSATVFAWLKSVISNEKRVKTKGAAEMLVKRRLGVLADLMQEYALRLSVEFVPSEKNRADVLTRIRGRWMKMLGETDKSEVGMCCLTYDEVKEHHDMHHMGIDKTLYLIRKVDRSVNKETVRQVVRQCMRCQSIDPAPITHQAGELQVAENWQRLAIDVTHYRGAQYLTMVDCGPSRFAIWKKLNTETASEIADMLNKIFLERGPVDEVLLDNGTAFRSETVREMLDKWNTRRYFRAAYRPEGNGIVERNHRTVKALAERGRTSPEEALFWYNVSPRTGLGEETVPHELVYRYTWRHPRAMPARQHEEPLNKIKIGDEVWVKPPGARCTTQWNRGMVTGSHSDNNISVDGVPRHILDVRPVKGLPMNYDQQEELRASDARPGPRQRPQRDRRPPNWAQDYRM